MEAADWLRPRLIGTAEGNRRGRTTLGTRSSISPRTAGLSLEWQQADSTHPTAATNQMVILDEFNLKKSNRVSFFFFFCSPD